MKKHFLKKIIVVGSVFILSACNFFNVKETPITPTPKDEEEFDTTLIDRSKSSNIVKDYVYMYHIDGLKDSQKDRLGFFSENYQAMINARSGKLLGLKPTNKSAMIEENNLDSIAMRFEVGSNGSFKTSVDENVTGRIIDSGRYLNRWDNVLINFNGLPNQKGRIEYCAARDYLMINYQMFSLSSVTETLRLTLDFANYSLTKINSRVIQALDSNNNGFLFVKQTTNDSTNFEIQSYSLVISKTVNLSPKIHSGLGFAVIPLFNGNTKSYNNFLNNEQIEISATKQEGNSLPVSYNPSDGVYYIDNNIGSCNPNSNDYDIVNFKVLNRSGSLTYPMICFQKKAGFSATGVSPMIYDTFSMEPTGEQVQISKNWHSFQSENPSQAYYMPSDDPRWLFVGPWLHAYTRLKLKNTDLLEKTLVIAYGKWGETYTVSHAQLSLIGYNGFQLWDQSALGSWGESITYDPDIGLNRSMIDDVRPFLVTAPTGGNKQFNWSGNVGGADFLQYSDANGDHNIINQRISYITQAPNITNVNYFGNSNDGKIQTSITINMGRTDDLPRAFYNLEYTFLDDVEFSNLAFFKLGATKYADNQYTKYAYGDRYGLIEQDLSASQDLIVENHTAQNSDFFFGLYNSSNNDEHGDTMLCVREFNATINNNNYLMPGYRFVNTTNGNKQVSCEITLPTECGNVIEKGSKVKLVVEYAILPDQISTYYGQSDYLNLTKNIMGTADALYQQVVGGKIDVRVIKGELVSTYPLSIYSNQNNEVEFKICGGLGYYPVFIDGLNSYNGLKLQKKENDTYIDVDQHVASFKTDFYQCYYNEETDKYQLGYNIFNTQGKKFQYDTNYYRLVKGR